MTPAEKLVSRLEIFRDRLNEWRDAFNATPFHPQFEGGSYHETSPEALALLPPLHEMWGELRRTVRSLGAPMQVQYSDGTAGYPIFEKAIAQPDPRVPHLTNEALNFALQSIGQAIGAARDLDRAGGEQAMFDIFMTDVVTINASDGTIHRDVKASVQKHLIMISKTDIPIRPGDQIVRRTPAGVDEVFDVEDPGFQSGMGGMPPHYQVRVRRADVMRLPPSHHGGTVIYNVTGSNARFNIDSVDPSTNVGNHAPAELFQALRDAIQIKILSERERDELLVRAKDLEHETGKPGFPERYAQ